MSIEVVALGGACVSLGFWIGFVAGIIFCADVMAQIEKRVVGSIKK